MGSYFGKHQVFAVNAHSKNKARHKVDVLKEFLINKDYEKVVVIGDSPSDMELGFVSGSIRYLYTHPGRQHREAKADFKIDDLRKVLNEL